MTTIHPFSAKNTINSRTIFKIVFTLSMLFFSLKTYAQVDWAVAFDSGDLVGWDTGFSMTTDNLENSYITGQFFDTVDFDPGPGVANIVSNGSTDLYIEKMDPNGNLIWTYTAGGAGSDAGLSIALDGTGNVYVTGLFMGLVDFDPGVGNADLISNGDWDVFILKLDPNGNFVWAKSYGSADTDQTWDLKIDQSGNLYTIGTFDSHILTTLDFDPGPGIANTAGFGFNFNHNIFIQKLDSDGNFIWVKVLGGIEDDHALGLAIDNANNLIITGEFNGTADFDPNAGVSNLVSIGGSDVFVSKLDSSGGFIWAKSFEGNVGSGYSIVTDDLNNIYLTGNFEATMDFDPGVNIDERTTVGDKDIFIAKLSEAGDLVWVNTYGSLDEDYGRRIAINGSNDIFVTGHFSGNIDFGTTNGNVNYQSDQDIFIQKISESGSSVYARSFGSGGDDRGMSICVSQLGSVHITGMFTGIVDFGTGVNLESYFQSSFVLKLNPSETTGIHTINNDPNLVIFPNPNNGEFNLEMAEFSSDMNIEIYNVIGKLVWQSGNDWSISSNIILHEPSGIYTVKVTNGINTSICKVIVQ